VVVGVDTAAWFVSVRMNPDNAQNIFSPIKVVQGMKLVEMAAYKVCCISPY
jgi:hypothetical protein